MNRRLLTPSLVITFATVTCTADGPMSSALAFNDSEQWHAVATLSGDHLSVRYSEFMLQVDFAPGVFVRRRVP